MGNKKIEDPTKELTTLEIDKIRSVMGTLPDRQPVRSDKLYRGVEGISVELIAITDNPYKSIFTIATSTWGKKINKWSDTTPEGRFAVVKAALSGQTLPTALEAVNMTFAVEGVSRSSFDQTARLRIGAGFGARGVRDNSHADVGLRVPEELWDDPEIIEDTENVFRAIKNLYCKILDRGNKSWQSARFILPLGMNYGFSVTGVYLAFRNYCLKRMKLCEQSDTVATAWLIRKALLDNGFNLLAEYLRPGCDYAGQCQYHKSYALSEMFGCLFKECGRNICHSENMYSEFNQSCTDSTTLAKQLRIYIPGPDEFIDHDLNSISMIERKLFTSD